MSMNKYGKVATIVSTYNRVAYLRECLRSLLAQDPAPDTIIIVDGSETAGTEEIIRKEFAQVEYVRVRENIGGAGQIYIGMKIAYKEGYDWFWIMDDDVRIIRKDGLKILLSKVQKLRSAGVPVGAVIPLQLIKGGVVKIEPLSIFVGGLISREVIDKVGFPRYDFFLYYDDVEYAYRITIAGFTIKYAPPILEHRGWPQRPSFHIRFLKRTSSLPILSKKRMFYLTRNGIIFSKEYKLMTLLIRIIAGSLIRGIAYTFLLQDPLMVFYVIRGLIEGFFGFTKTRIL